MNPEIHKQELWKKETKARNTVIDIARGFCIMFMILVHISGWWGKYDGIHKYLGLFFLVFFFFCSGLFYREPEDTLEYIRKRLIRLEIPYAVVCTLVLLKRYSSGVHSQATLVNSFFYSLPASFSAPYMIVGEETTGIGPIWFLNCLFICNCLYLALNKTEKRLKTVLILALAVAASISQKYCVLPFNIQDAIIGVMFMHMGVLAAPFLKRMIRWAEKNPIKTMLLFFVVLIVYCFDINCLPYQNLDLGSNRYNMGSLIGSSLGFILLVFGSVLTEKIPFAGQLMAFIGRNSIIILIIHAVDIDILRNWSHMSWPFVFATFAVYIGTTFIYVELRNAAWGK